MKTEAFTEEKATRYFAGSTGGPVGSLSSDEGKQKRTEKEVRK